MAKVNPIAVEMIGEGCGKKGKCSCQQHGAGIADLAVKALSHLLPKLLESLGSKAGDFIGEHGIAFAKKKGLISGGASSLAGGASSLAGGGKPRGRPRKTLLKEEESEHGVRTKTKIDGTESTTANKGPVSSFSTTPGITPAPKKTGGRPKKGQTGSGASSGTLPIGGGSNLAGDGVFLAGADETPLPKRGKKKPLM